jgi:hypothetical protein
MIKKMHICVLILSFLAHHTIKPMQPTGYEKILGLRGADPTHQIIQFIPDTYLNDSLIILKKHQARRQNYQGPDVKLKRVEPKKEKTFFKQKEVFTEEVSTETEKKQSKKRKADSSTTRPDKQNPVKHRRTRKEMLKDQDWRLLTGTSRL